MTDRSADHARSLVAAGTVPLSRIDFDRSLEPQPEAPAAGVNPVCTIDAFYDTGVIHPLYPWYGENIFMDAAETIARYTGPIALNVSGLALPAKPEKLDITELELGDAPFAMLLTNRLEVGSPGPFSYCTTGDIDHQSRTLTAARSIISLSDKGESSIYRAIDFTVREMGRMLGAGVIEDTPEGPDLMHCPDPNCIMAAAPRLNDGGRMIARLSSRPFCDPCIAGMEFAVANMALVQQA